MKHIKKILVYIILSALGIFMLYPVIWLIGASFKSNSEIFSSIWFMPESFDFTPYINGWKTSGAYTMGHYFMNTFRIVVPKVIFSVISSTLTAYGFAMYDFPFKRLIFGCLMCMLFMPQTVMLLPSYMMWNYFDMLDTYIPLILPSLFASEGMFVFMLIQFFKAVPKEIGEASRIDGCGALKRLVLIYIPCIKPAVISVAVFTFLWSMNDFIAPLIYISSVGKYPLTLALRMSADSTGQGYEYNKIIAMSVLGLIPSVSVFAIAQKYFIQDITAGGLK
ncbi:MAG: carbohydrate ABC transporter permease [Oscillospiraceae bacterium]|nr:carbohydrate ABC transporter permease [Oscillospiraceae bacterium]